MEQEMAVSQKMRTSMVAIMTGNTGLLWQLLARGHTQRKRGLGVRGIHLRDCKWAMPS
jgi:hypothetical protein